MPFGQVPALEVDGVFLAQSLSIARYLGHRFGLAGRTPIEHAQVDGLLQTIDEMRQPASSAFWAKDKAKMQAWHDGDLGKWLDVLEQHCAKYSPSKKWLVGDAMTVADISLYRELSELRDHPVQGVSISDVLDKHPLVCGILANVAANAGIAHWVAHRKESEW